MSILLPKNSTFILLILLLIVVACVTEENPETNVTNTTTVESKGKAPRDLLKKVTIGTPIATIKTMFGEATQQWTDDYGNHLEWTLENVTLKVRTKDGESADEGVFYTFQLNNDNDVFDFYYVDGTKEQIPPLGKLKYMDVWNKNAREGNRDLTGYSSNYYRFDQVDWKVKSILRGPSVRDFQNKYDYEFANFSKFYECGAIINEKINYLAITIRDFEELVPPQWEELSKEGLKEGC